MHSTSAQNNLPEAVPGRQPQAAQPIAQRQRRRHAVSASRRLVALDLERGFSELQRSSRRPPAFDGAAAAICSRSGRHAAACSELRQRPLPAGRPRFVGGSRRGLDD